MTITPDEREDLLAAARRSVTERLLRGAAPTASPVQTPDAARSPEEPVPLSPEQHSLWLVGEMLGAHAGLYSVHEVVRLHGAVEVSRLRTALDRLVARHEALRTVVVETEDGPMQIVRAPGPAAFTVVDRTEHGGDPMASVRAELARRFDLEAGPLFRAALVEADGDHLLVLHLHHLIADEWSCQILATDLSRLYRGVADVAAPGRYTDYARRALEGAADGRQTHLDHWRRALSDVDPYLELPIDRPHPPEPTYRGDGVVMTVPPNTANRLRQVAAEAGVTPFVAVLAGLAATLGGYSGQTRFAVGTPMSRRGTAGTDETVGLFVNTVAVPVDLADGPELRDLMIRLRRTVAGALDHADVSIEEVVRALNVRRAPDRNPLFQVLFQYLDDHEDWWDLPGITTEPVDLDEATEKFELTLVARDDDGAIRLELRYATDLFEADTARRLLRSLVAVLEQMAADPARRTGDLDLLGADDLHRQLRSWNDTEVPLRETTLASLFAEQAARTPDACAVVDDQETLTYAELAHRVSRVAAGLRRAGVGPDVPVGVCLQRSFRLVTALLAVEWAGGAYVPLDPDHPDGRHAMIVADTGMSVVLVDQETAGRWTGDEVVVLDVDRQAAITDDGTSGLTAVSPDDLAYIIFTSGSTGRPKGVCVPHRGVVNRLQWMQKAYPIGTGDTVVQKTPFSFDVSVWEFFWPLTVGARLVVAEPGGHQDPAYLADLIRRSAATVVHFVPSMLAEFLADPTVDDLPSLRHVICSGEALPAGLADQARSRLTAELHNLYGPTEASIDVSAYTCVSAPGEATVPIGRPIDNTRLYVLNDALRPMPVGVPGELFIGGVGLARGYVGRPVLTAGSFVPDPFHGGRMYRTGDVARWRTDGSLEFLGRIDDQVKVHGHRIELDEIVSTLLARPDIAQAAVVPQQTSAGALRLVAYVVPTPGHVLSASDLTAHLRGTLPEYMVPATYVPLDALPLTSSGKVNRKALPDVSPAAASRAEPTRPRDETERVLAAIWAELLDLDFCGVRDNFFDIGGDSILAVRIANRARAAGLPVTPRLLLRHQTVAEVVAALRATDGPAADGHGAAPARAAEPLPDGVESVHRLSALQEGMLFETIAFPAENRYAQYHAFDVDQPLDEEALASALREVCARHPALRSRFAWRGRPHPVQEVHCRAEPELVVLDWRADASPRRYEDFLAEDRAEPIELTGPINRFTALRTGDSSYRLVWRTHHILLDGWSTEIVVRELFQIVGGLRNGTSVDLPDPVPAAAHRAWLAGRDRDADAVHWQKVLGGFTTPTALPVNRLPTEEGGRAGTALELLNLDRGQLDRLTEVSRRWRVSLGSLVTAAWGLLLRRFGGGDDVVVGVTVNGRSGDFPRIEQVVGLLMNTLPVRMRIGEGITAGAVARAVQDQMAELHEHVHCSLVDAKRQSAVRADERLFDSIVVFQHEEREPALPPEVSPVPGSTALDSGYPLVLDVTAGDGLCLQLAYQRTCGEAETIRRLLAHLAIILTAIADDRSGSIDTLDALPDVERERVLRTWNDTDAWYPSETCLHELFEQAARENPAATAIVDVDGSSVSYADLDESANRLAHHLRARGVGPEQIVGVLLDHSVEMFVALLGVLKAGGAYLPLDPGHPSDRLKYYLRDSGARLVVTRADLAALATDGENLPAVLLDAEAAQIAERPATSPQTGVTARNLVYIMYTSGSTGRPKGVLIDHRGLINYLWWARSGYGIDGADGAPMVGSIAFDLSVPNFFLPLTAGLSVTLLPPDEGLGNLADLLTEPADFSLLKITPGHLDVLRRMVQPDSVHSVRTFVVGADEVRTETALGWRKAAPRARIINEYGPTETVVGCSTYVLPDEVDPELPLPIGRPIANIRMYVLDRHLSPVPIGVTGELFIGGDGVARGYHRRPSVTAERFLPDPYASEPGARFYRTGDLARWRADGNLDFLGRCDDQVKIRGYRVELGEIEARLLAHPDIVEGAVAAFAHESGDRRLVAYLVPRPDGQLPSAVDLQEWLARDLPTYMRPAQFVCLPELPLTAAGKVDRSRLPAPGPVTRDEEAGYVAARTETERRLVSVWEQALGVTGVGVHDDFFGLGGDSIVSVRLVALAQEYGLAVNPRDVFRHPTVAGLAAVVTLAEPAAAEPAPERSAAEPPVAGPDPLTGLDDEAAAVLRTQLRELDTAEVYRLTHLQTGMLLHRLADPQRDEYFRQFIWDLDGDLDVGTFVTAWQRVIDRHAALRTRFIWQDLPHPVQVVVRAQPIVVERWDCRSTPDGERVGWLERLAADERERGIDLTAGPPMRLVLIRTGSTRHRLLWNVHHLVLDGWSRSIVSREVLETYAAMRTGGALPADPPAPFRDYLSWLDRHPANRDMGYWRRTLAGLRGPTPLPAVAAGRRPGTGIGVEESTLADSLFQALRDTAARYRISLPNLLQGAWALLLSRHCGTDDVVFGTTLAGRSADVPGIDRMVGMLMNTLPTRIGVSPDMSIGDWLTEVHRGRLTQQEHAGASLVEIARCVDVPRGERLFTNLFVLERAADEEEGEWAGLRVDQSDGAPGETAYPLVLTVSVAGHLELGLKFEHAVYDRDAVAELLGHYRMLLEAVTVAPADDPVAAWREVVPAPVVPEPAPAASSGAAGPAGTGLAAAVTEAERVLAEIWKGVLRLDRVGPEDDYFALGGDSVLAFQVVTLGRRAGLSITVQDVLRDTRLRDLAATVAPGAAVEVAAPRAEHPDPWSAVPLTPAQHRLLDQRVPHDHYNQSVQVDWHGAADPGRLGRALRALTAQHDALRLRLDRAAPDRRQRVAPVSDTNPLRVVDLGTRTADERRDEIRAIADRLHTGLDLADGPLLRAALIRADGFDDRVVVVVHHWAVDTYSWRILLDDLATVYRTDDPAALTPVPTSFGQWATRLAAYASSGKLDEERELWQAVAREPVAPPPAVDVGGINRESATRTVEAVLDEADTSRLTRRAAHGVPMQTLVLAALGDVLVEWAGGGLPVSVDIEGHGREPLFDDVDLSRTVGWFTARYPVVVRPVGRGGIDTAVDALADTLAAIPHHGIGHGLLRHLAGQADLASRSWVSLTHFGHLLDQGDGAGLFHGVDDDSTARAPAGERRYLLDVRSWVRDGRLHVDWTFTAGNVEERVGRRRLQEHLQRLRKLAAPADRPVPASWQRLEPGSALMAAARRRCQAPAVSVAVIADGQVARAWGEGTTDARGGAAVDAETIFQACSVSKHVTTVGVLRLAMDGVLDLDADVRTHLTGGLRGASGPVTLRGLLGHVAGLVQYGHPGHEQADPLPTLADMILGRPPAATPPIEMTGAAGTFGYSGANFTVVQSVLQAVTGEPFAETMRRLVLDPLGMRDSSFDQAFPHLRPGRVAHGHRDDGTHLPGGWRVFPQQAASGLWTTAADLAKVAVEIRAAATGEPSRVLDRASAQAMITPEVPGGRYGLGCVSKVVDGHRWFGHPGDRHSFQCMTATDLDDGAGLVVLSNIGGRPFLADLFAELEFPMPPTL